MRPVRPPPPQRRPRTGERCRAPTTPAVGLASVGAVSDETGESDGVGSRTRWQRLVLQHPDVHAERYWPAYLALGAAVILQVRLPSAYNLGPRWILPIIEAVLLAVLVLGRYANPRRRDPLVMRRLHLLGIGLIAIISVDNLTSLGLLIRKLLRGLDTDGRTLILSALAIWVTNVIVFALWFWEFDGGGPVPRRADPDGRRDFLFPQIQLQQDETEVLARDAELVELGKLVKAREPKYVGWLPDFVDYFYVSFTNATAFSPTDTMPLSRWAKMLMLVQSAAALLTIALIAARAVNILK